MQEGMIFFFELKWHPGTGEHGVGLGKKEYLTSELGEGTIELMKTIKRAVDPLNILNPGKVSDIRSVLTLSYTISHSFILERATISKFYWSYLRILLELHCQKIGQLSPVAVRWKMYISKLVKP